MCTILVCILFSIKYGLSTYPVCQNDPSLILCQASPGPDLIKGRVPTLIFRFHPPRKNVIKPFSLCYWWCDKGSQRVCHFFRLVIWESDPYGAASIIIITFDIMAFSKIGRKCWVFYVECHLSYFNFYTECHYAECQYTVCCGATPWPDVRVGSNDSIPNTAPLHSGKRHLAWRHSA